MIKILDVESNKRHKKGNIGFFDKTNKTKVLSKDVPLSQEWQPSHYLGKQM